MLEPHVRAQDWFAKEITDHWRKQEALSGLSEIGITSRPDYQRKSPLKIVLWITFQAALSIVALTRSSTSLETEAKMCVPRLWSTPRRPWEGSGTVSTCWLVAG